MGTRILYFIRHAVLSVRTTSLRFWKWFSSRPRWQQAGMALIALAVLIGGGVAIAQSGGTAASADQMPTVTTATVGALSGTDSSVSVLGTVRSVSEADILAQAGGTVEAVHTKLGASVPAGFVVAELDNAIERAQVLQAEGAYESALAARTSVSPADATLNARNTYRTSFSTMDTTLHTQIDVFFGNETPVGPQLLLNQGSMSIDQISRNRVIIGTMLEQRRSGLSSVATRDPEQLLNESESDLNAIATLVSNIAEAANQRGSNVTTAQTAALIAARTAIDGQLAAISGAREAYRAKSTTSTASVDASVKSALGTLRLAQANLEKSIVRAPIGGSVNFLPIRVGDYVTPLEHVATIAQNGALEIVTSVSENDRANLSAGMKVRIDDKYDGIVTAISPALDPNTKQIEVHVAVSGTTALEDGQSVHISFANAIAPTDVKVATTTAQGPLLLPLTALKLTSAARVVFSVGTDGRLVAHPVTIGDVQGDRIEVTSSLPSDLQIVSDARGLSEGEQVKVAASAP